MGDQELWRRAAAGEADCFGLIFDRHAGAVHAYCRARSSGVADERGESAADLVSMVFLEAWRRRRDVVLEADSALPWLLGVARRVMLHRARTVRRHRAALARLSADYGWTCGQVEDPADEIARRLDAGHRLSAVRYAFTTLQDSDREVLLLCVWGGLDYAAAAVALGVPTGTVRSRLSRARARLAELAASAPMHSLRLPPDPLPSQGLPARPPPSRPLPPQTLPSRPLPSQALPSQALPSRALPSQALPSQALPSEPFIAASPHEEKS